ncbi:MAG: NAD(P)/FAD-dependent oxidoreductase, partial [Candidatus Dormibacteraceae bacterium]
IRLRVAQSKDELLPRMKAPLRQAAATRLHDETIELRTDSAVKSVDQGGVVLENGDRLDGSLVIWTAGVEANPVARRFSGAQTDSRGRLQVDDQLRVGGRREAYALGDVASVRSGDDQVAPTAQAAVQAADVVAWNVSAAILGGEPKTFSYHDAGHLVELGSRFAVAQVFGAEFSGWAGQILWRLVYLYKLGDWRDRLHVFSDWTIRLLEPASVPRLGLR